MRAKIILHKIPITNHTDCEIATALKDNDLNRYWLSCVKNVVLNSNDLIDLWSAKLKELENLGYRSLGHFFLKTHKINVINENQNYWQIEIINFFDFNRFDDNRIKDYFVKFIKKLFNRLSIEGIIKTSKSIFEKNSKLATRSLGS